MEENKDPIVLTDSIYRLYRHGDYIKIQPYEEGPKIPDMSQITFMDDLIVLLKEWHRRYLIDAKTGGPMIDRAGQYLELLKKHLKPEDIQRIEIELYGDPEKRKLDKEKIDKFKVKVHERYFHLYTNKEPNHYLWSTKSWIKFKEHIFKDFIRENFLSDLPQDLFTYQYKDEKDDRTSPLKSIHLDGTKLYDGIEKRRKYCDGVLYPIIKDIQSFLSECKRLGMTGKIISEIYTKTKALYPPLYWLPISINDKERVLDIIRSDGTKFCIEDREKRSIIAVVPFDSTTHEIVNRGSNFVTDLMFKQSYLYYIIETIDKTLNEAMEALFVKYGLSQFFAFTKI